MAVLVLVVTHRDQYRPLVRKMRAAAKAAPNPLSMLQTVMPDAQLVSMHASAVTPPNAAP
jgi:hypothetical protein